MIKCEICNKTFEKFKYLSYHLKVHNMTAKKYYDIYFKKDDEGICSCGKETIFINAIIGYQLFCGVKCSNKDSEKKKKVAFTNLEKYGNICSLAHKDVREKTKKTLIKNFGVENPFNLEIIRNKAKATNLQRFGVEHVSQNREIQEKINNTMFNRYGGHSSKSKKVKEKQKATNIKNFGSSCPLQHKDVIIKTVKTNIVKFGCSHPFQNKDIQEKYKQTCLENFGVDHPVKSEKIKNKIVQTNIKKYGVSHLSQTKERVDYMKNGGAAHCNQFIRNPSRPQTELFELCQSILPYPVMNYPCMNKSIDIAIPCLSIAIEYDGSYWHQDIKSDNDRQDILEIEGWNFLRYIDKVPTKEELLLDINNLLKVI